MDRATFIGDCGIVPFVLLGNRLFITDRMELFDGQNSVRFESWDDAFAFTDGEFSFNDEVDSIGANVLIPLKGGNGSSSSSGNEKEFKFNHADDGGSGASHGTVRFPAEFNDGEKSQSLTKTLDKFRDKHAEADHEYGITVDEQGFVHKYHEGGSTSVGISGTKGQTIIHNHPNDSNFSDSDLLHVAQTQEKGIIAVGKSGDYIFEKTSKFKASDFAKALKSARPTGKDYNDATSKWLTANQGKYGYKFRFRKAK